MDFFTQLISTLMQSRTQAHVYHLQTPSYAAHVALNAYYDGIIPLVDALTESYQGKYGILRGYATTGLMEYESCEKIINYFVALDTYIEQSRAKIPQDTFIQNQVDTIVELINSTIYKLKHLK